MKQLTIEQIESSYLQFWDDVKDKVDEEGWVYTKEVSHLLDSYFQGHTGKLVEFQKSFGMSGDNPNWLTRGSK